MAKDSEESQKQAPKKSKLMLIIVVVVVLLLAAGGAFVYLTVLSKPAQDEGTEQMAPDANGGDGVSKAGELGVMYDLPPFIVNLSDPTGSRYLKVGISVEISSKNQKIAGELDQRLPKVKDTIITVLSSKTLEEIQTPQGKVSLKQELLRRINSILTTGKLLDLYLTDFVVQ